MGYSTAAAMIGTHAVAAMDNTNSGKGVFYLAKQDETDPVGTAVENTNPSFIIGGKAGITVNVDGTGYVTVQYSRILDSVAGPAGSPNVPAITGGNIIVYSSGPWDAGSGIRPAYHGPTNKPNTGQAINFQTGGQTTVDIPVPDKKKAHGALMGLGWGFILPIGFLVARHLRFLFGSAKLFGLDAWFIVHLCLQWTGLIITTAGFAIGLNDIGTNTFKSHRILGCSIMALGYFQPVNAHLRNAIGAHIEKGQPKSNMRIAWEYVHKNVGRTACIAAVAQIFMGFDILKNQATLDPGYRHAYSVGVAVIGSLFLVFEFKRILFGVGGGGPAQPVPATPVVGGTELQGARS